jgi:polysaccharide biosynthesis transport protein
MSSDGAVVLKPLPSAEPLGMYASAPQPADQQPQVNLFKVLHRHLRGRYRLTLALAAVGALAGGIGGFLVRSPKYRAEGLIRVQPVLPRILYQNEESSLQPMFASFVNTQASLLQNPRVVAKARNSAAWKALGRPADADDEQEFTRQLVVKTTHDTPELIFVSFTDKQAQAAFVAVQEVINAYLELFGGSESKSVRELQINTLTTLKKTLENDKVDKEKLIANLASEFESDDLARLGDHYLTQLLASDDHVHEARLELAEKGIDPDKFPDTPPAANPASGAPAGPPPPVVRTAEQIATVDHTMAQYLVDRDGIRRQLDRLRDLGYGEQHQSVKSLAGDLAAIEKVIKDRTDKWIEPPSLASAGMIGDLSPVQLVGRYRRLRQQSEALRARSEAISKAKVQIETLRGGLKTSQDSLEDVNRRLAQINVESKVQDQIGRIEPILPEAAPSTPNDDPRKKFAAIGFIFGGGFPVAFMLLLSLIDRRFRYADQADESTGEVPMLGILPDLPGAGGDPEQIAAAVHCIHHIRTRLQLTESARSNGKVYTVTSPTAGDGKTSLALSLGMSFTSSGAKTVLVDFDLVGHALSTRLGATAEQGLGHHLVFPNGHALVADTPVPRLSLVAAGTEDVRFHSRVGREAFSAMIEGLRNQFDIVIIDTGPILGSLESNIAVSVADGVVMVVGRGQLGARVREAISRATQLGARVSGMVFNRAYAMDFNRSALASTSIRSIRAMESARPEPKPAPDHPLVASFDPLAQSVARDVQQ